MSTKKSGLPTYRAKLQPLYASKFVTRDNASVNAGLWLDKYIQKQDKEDTESRVTLIKQVAALHIPEAYIHFYKRWEHTLTDSGVKRQQMRLAHTKGRMIVGLGDESVLETSIALHHTYGVPYIPGSALKGLAASYARQRLGEDWKKDAPSKAYNTIFGDTNEVGCITFFDALLYIDPDANKRPKSVLHQDTITVHHPDYYQKQEKPPSDRDSPTPIPFLSVTGSYLIALAAPDLENGSLWIDKTFEILTYALEEMGIGAKTSSGYGRMTLEAMPMDEKVRR